MRHATGLLAVFIWMSAGAQAQPFKGQTRGDLAGNLEVLNAWGPRPEAVQHFYEAAYKILAARSDASYAEVGADPRVRRLAVESGLTHFGGPMLGAVTAKGAKVWMRTFQPAEVAVALTLNGVEKVYGPVRSTVETDLTAVVEVTGLEPGARYPYRVLIDGQPVAVPADAAIVTAPDDTKPGKVRIAFGTCFHRWGLGNPRQAELIRDREPAALLLYGDIAVQDRRNHFGLHRADYLMRDLFPAWRDLAAAVPVYATWDDHDYFDNDLAGIPPGHTAADREGLWEVFRRAWNNPTYGFGVEGRGVFLRTRISPCDIIMTDNRYFRSGEKGSFLGDEQMQWLKKQLADCRGPFIILSCGTMWSDYVSDGKDSWGKWNPEGRERLFRFIEKNRIAGVLLISGDRHGARGFRIPRPSGFSFYEFEAGSLGGRSGPPVTRPEWDTQLYGFADVYAFGEFTIDAAKADPEVTFRLIQDDGTVLHEQTLTRSQLTPPAE